MNTCDEIECQGLERADLISFELTLRANGRSGLNTYMMIDIKRRDLCNSIDTYTLLGVLAVQNIGVCSDR